MHSQSNTPVAPTVWLIALHRPWSFGCDTAPYETAAGRTVEFNHALDPAIYGEVSFVRMHKQMVVQACLAITYGNTWQHNC